MATAEYMEALKRRLAEVAAEAAVEDAAQEAAQDEGIREEEGLPLPKATKQGIISSPDTDPKGVFPTGTPYSVVPTPPGTPRSTPRSGLSPLEQEADEEQEAEIAQRERKTHPAYRPGESIPTVSRGDVEAHMRRHAFFQGEGVKNLWESAQAQAGRKGKYPLTVQQMKEDHPEIWERFTESVLSRSNLRREVAMERFPNTADLPGPRQFLSDRLRQPTPRSESIEPKPPPPAQGSNTLEEVLGRGGFRAGEEVFAVTEDKKPLRRKGTIEGGEPKVLSKTKAEGGPPVFGPAPAPKEEPTVRERRRSAVNTALNNAAKSRTGSQLTTAGFAVGDFI
tara:strand:- start:1074 stop:2084 length:1011 start_codon:yes stop_codon:yes gene_type:complete